MFIVYLYIFLERCLLNPFVHFKVELFTFVLSCENLRLLTIRFLSDNVNIFSLPLGRFSFS